MTVGADAPACPAFTDRLAGFDAHWRSIEPELKRIEAGRWLSLVGGGALFALGIVVYLFGDLLAQRLFDVTWADPGRSHGQQILGVALFTVAILVARRPSRRAGRLIKQRVAAFLGLSYSGGASGFPFDTFTANDLLPSHSDKALQDHVAGEVAGVPIEICDARLTRQSLGDDREVLVTVFRGPLVVAKFPKRPKGRTIVVPDGGSIGNFFGNLAQGTGERVRLESPEFERRFEVYSSDQVEARYLLTPTMMERLVALQKRFDAKVWLAFTGRELLLALDDRRDWFPDPRFLQGLTDPGLVREQVEEIARLAEVVETLKLNAETRT